MSTTPEYRAKTPPTTLNLAVNPDDHEIEQDDAERFENGSKENESKKNIEAFVRFRMIACEINSRRNETFSENKSEYFADVSEIRFKMMNGDLHQKFRDYLSDHGVYIAGKKNPHICTTLSKAMRNGLDHPGDDPSRPVPPFDLSASFADASKIVQNSLPAHEKAMKVKIHWSKTI